MPDLSSRVTLTDTIVRKFKPKADRFEVPDGIVSGLRLIVQPSGAKSWAVRTRLNGKPIKITLGPVALDALDLKAVREGARAALEAAQSGEVPSARPEPLLLTGPAHARGVAFPVTLPTPAIDPATTVDAVWRRYLAEHLRPKIMEGKSCDQATADNAPTMKRYKGVFGDTAKAGPDDKRPLSLWRNRPVKEITRDDVRPVINAAAQRGPEARNSTITVLSSFFNWAAKPDQDLIPISPVDGFEKTEGDEGERFLEDDEVKIFWRGCDALGKSNSVFGPMFQMLLLTGQRRTEVSAMRYSEISGRIWTIPGSRTKNHKPHPVYLSDAALACLANLKRLAGSDGEPSDFVFTTSGDAPSSGYSKAKTALGKLTAGLAPWVLHDLRRTFTTGCASLGIPESIADRCLNHISKKKAASGTARRYNKFKYAPQMQEAWIKWGEYVSDLTTAKRARALAA
jgi:integrase